jgi:hypothetical protein
MRYIQNPVRVKACMLWGKAWPLWAWLHEINCIERWASCDGRTIEATIQAERFAAVLPKLQRFAFGAIEFHTVGR